MKRKEKINYLDIVRELNRKRNFSKFRTTIELVSTEEMLKIIAWLESFYEPVEYKPEKKVERLDFD